MRSFTLYIKQLPLMRAAAGGVSKYGPWVSDGAVWYYAIPEILELEELDQL